MTAHFHGTEIIKVKSLCKKKRWFREGKIIYDVCYELPGFCKTTVKLYAHGMLLVRCVRCVCDCYNEFNASSYANACAWSGAFVAHGLGWTGVWDPKVGDDLGVLQCKTVLPNLKLHKPCCGALHKTLTWLVTCIQNKRKLPNLTHQKSSTNSSRSGRPDHIDLNSVAVQQFSNLLQWAYWRLDDELICRKSSVFQLPQTISNRSVDVLHPFLYLNTKQRLRIHPITALSGTLGSESCVNIETGDSNADHTRRIRKETSPWSRGKRVRFGAGRSSIRLSAGSYQDLVNWYCSLLTRRTVYGRAAGNTTRTQNNPSENEPRNCTKLRPGPTRSL